MGKTKYFGLQEKFKSLALLGMERLCFADILVQMNMICVSPYHPLLYLKKMLAQAGVGY